MILRKWEPNLTKLHFDFDRLPLWFHLHHVPLELFTKPGLSYLASAIGTPLYMDSITVERKRLLYAKVCIEVKAGAEIPNIINAIFDDGFTATVSVSMPWKPSSCTSCSIFGHSDGNCPKKVKASQFWQPKGKGAAPVVATASTVLGTTDSTVPNASSSSEVPVNATIVRRSGLQSKSRITGSTNKLKELQAISPASDELVLSDGFQAVKGGKSPPVVQPAADSIHENNYKMLQDGEDIVVSDDEIEDLNVADIPCSSKDVPQAKTTKTRDASKGVSKVLMGMRSRKDKKLADAKLLTSNSGKKVRRRR